jgi:hypothetical protein
MVLTWLVKILFYLTIGVWCIFHFAVVSSLFSLVACFRLDEMFSY